MKRIGTFFAEFLKACREEGKSGLGWLLGLTFAILIGSLRIPESKQKEWLGSHGVEIFDTTAVILLIILLLLIFWLAVRVFGTFRLSSDPSPDLEKSTFHCKVLDTFEDVQHINVNLVHLVFPNAPLPPDEGRSAQAQNSRRIIGLIKTDSDEIVGWASIWPVSTSVGRAIEAGDRNDDDLSAEDLLPTWRNGRAKYLVLRAFTVLPKYRSPEDGLAFKLGRFVVAHIIEEFLRSPDRSIRLLAIAYTENGRKLCRRFGLVANGRHADYGPKEGKKPIYAANFTMKKLCRLLGDS